MMAVGARLRHAALSPVLAPHLSEPNGSATVYRTALLETDAETLMCEVLVQTTTINDTAAGINCN